MSGVNWSANVENVAASVAANLTFMQLVAGSNHRVKLKRLIVTGQGITIADTPVTFELLKQTTAGTASPLTPVKLNDSDDETLEMSAQKTFTAEPTAGNIKYSFNVASTGRHEIVWPLGFELFINGGERLGLRALQASQASVFTVPAEGEE